MIGALRRLSLVRRHDEAIRAKKEAERSATETFARRAEVERLSQELVMHGQINGFSLRIQAAMRGGTGS